MRVNTRWVAAAAITITAVLAGCTATGTNPKPAGGPAGTNAKPASVSASSVVGVISDGRCGLEPATGFVAGPGTVVSIAAPLAGQSDASVVVHGREVPATIVLFDRDRDVAILHVKGLDAPAVPFDLSEPPQRSTSLLGFAGDGVNRHKLRIVSDRAMLLPDVYNTHSTALRIIIATPTELFPASALGGPVAGAAGVSGMALAIATGGRVVVLPAATVQAELDLTKTGHPVPPGKVFKPGGACAAFEVGP